MSPPGNRIGDTTNESVVNASRAPCEAGQLQHRGVVEHAARARRRASAGAMTSRISALDSWPPDPWPRVTRWSSGIGAGQATASMSTVIVLSPPS